MTLYYEDLEVGDTYETREYTVTADEIVSFAQQFDPQPYHVDESAARESMFGGLIASGVHTLSLANKLYTTRLVSGEEGMPLMGGRGMDALRFHKPLCPGDTLRVRIEVIEKTPSESRADRGYVDFRLRAFTDAGEVMSVVYHVIIGRNADSASSLPS